MVQEELKEQKNSGEEKIKLVISVFILIAKKAKALFKGYGHILKLRKYCL